MGGRWRGAGVLLQARAGSGWKETAPKPALDAAKGREDACPHAVQNCSGDGAVGKAWESG